MEVIHNDEDGFLEANPSVVSTPELIRDHVSDDDSTSQGF